MTPPQSAYRTSFPTCLNRYLFYTRPLSKVLFYYTLLGHAPSSSRTSRAHKHLWKTIDHFCPYFRASSDQLKKSSQARRPEAYAAALPNGAVSATGRAMLTPLPTPPDQRVWCNTCRLTASSDISIPFFPTALYNSVSQLFLNEVRASFPVDPRVTLGVRKKWKVRIVSSLPSFILAMHRKLFSSRHAHSKNYSSVLHMPFVIHGRSSWLIRAGNMCVSHVETWRQEPLPLKAARRAAER